MTTIYKCRLCLNSTKKKVDIFKDDFPKMIELLSGIRVDPNDGLLKFSCVSCAKDVKFCMSVRKQILKSHKTLIEDFLKTQKLQSFNSVLSSTKVKQNLPVQNNQQTIGLGKTENDTHSSGDEGQDLHDYNNDTDDPQEQEGNVNLGCFFKSDSSENVIEEITIIHEDLESQEIKNESQKEDSLKTEAIDNIEEKSSVKQSSNVSPNKLLRKRNLIAASSKILNQQKTLNDRRYCNVIFVRKSRREKLNKHKLKVPSTPKNNKTDSDENVILKDGKKYAACEICKREVKKHYMKHHLSTHFPKDYTCDICGATTRNIRGLRYHKLYWHSSKLDYICHKCGKKYRSKHALDLHDKKEHGGVRDLECNICGKKFFQKMHLKRHIDGIHKKLRPHKCEYCGKDFSKRTHLVTHWRTHTNETPYGCDMCGDRFKLKLSLKSHLKRVHNFEEEERVFCNICHRGFTSEQGLKAHINSRVHEGMKCQYCSEIFTDEYMKNHMRDAHGMDVIIEAIENVY